GEYVLREQDCLAGVRAQDHPDIVAITDHSLDVHGEHGGLRELPNGAYGVPYRCLLPKGTANLLVACRAASFSQIAASSCRLQRAMITLGQAAGHSAAMAARDRVTLRSVDVAALQGDLRTQGVELPGVT
ncbi:MAG: FAD-dependent oxidoreductase, partial [Armatimonadetes bacterium]|nr:FAD-dependent oxidoreductase [Armatimonadota bacterium]